VLSYAVWSGKERMRRGRSGMCNNTTKGAAGEKTSTLLVEKDAGT